MDRQAIRVYVLDRLGVQSADTERVTQIHGLIDSEYERFCAVTKATLTDATVGFIAGSQAVAFPAHVLSVEAMRGSQGNAMRPIPVREMIRLEATYRGGMMPTHPSYYSVMSSTFGRIWPAPAADDDNAVIVYVGVPAPLAADASVPSSLPAWMHQYLAESVVYRMALTEEAFDIADRAARVIASGVPEMAHTVKTRPGGKYPVVGLDNDYATAFPPSPDQLGAR